MLNKILLYIPETTCVLPNKNITIYMNMNRFTKMMILTIYILPYSKLSGAVEQDIIIIENKYFEETF